MERKRARGDSHKFLTEMEFPLELSSHEIRDRRGPDPKTDVAALFAHRGDTGARP